MPKPSQSWFKRFFYNLNIKRDKSWSKYKNLMNHVVFLLKKFSKEWRTKWIVNAFAKAQLKITKYGIPSRHLSSLLDHKGLSQLNDVFPDFLLFVQKKHSK